MRLLLISLFAFISIQITNAQMVDQISVGSGYNLQTFYDIESGEQTSIAGDSWDIAFTVFGFQDAGVFLNEAAASMGVELELYDLGVESFSTSVTQGDLIDRLYNDDKSWVTGAFNEVRDVTDFSDFGWGTYNPATMSVDGERLYAIKLRNGKTIKFQIEALALTEYTFKYADLDGSNEKTVSFDKSEFSGKQLAYFSFTSEEMKDLEPTNWDLVFTRYSSPVPDGEDGILNYVVTGALAADGVSVAQADEIDPLNVMESDYSSLYSNDIDVIGFDWKDIDIATFQWSLILDRVYFVKTKANKTYKLYFIDFEGSSTGITTLQKTEVISTSTNNLIESQSTIGNLYPNPTSGIFAFDFETKTAHSVGLSIFQLDGKKVYNKMISVKSGKNTISINDFNQSGNYFFVLDTGNKVYSQTLIIK